MPRPDTPQAAGFVSWSLDDGSSRVLVTRAPEDGPSLATALRRAGLEPVMVPLVQRVWRVAEVAAAAASHREVDWVVSPTVMARPLLGGVGVDEASAGFEAGGAACEGGSAAERSVRAVHRRRGPVLRRAPVWPVRLLVRPERFPAEARSRGRGNGGSVVFWR